MFPDQNRKAPGSSNPSCSISTTVLYDHQATLKIEPGATITMFVNFKTVMACKMMVLVPAQPPGEESVSLSVTVDGAAQSGLTCSNQGKVQPEWLEIGPVELGGKPGNISVSATSNNGGTWPGSTQPFYLAAVSIDDQPLNVQYIADAQASNDSSPLDYGSADDPQTDYYTSFEDSGSSYFLSYIPWIYNRRIVCGAPVEQSNVALNGQYSCKFYETIVATSSLETQNLNIPANTASASISGWFYVQLYDLKIDVHIVIDGHDNKKTLYFMNDEAGKWVYRQYVIDIPAGAKTFYGWLQLKPNPSYSSNIFYLDNFMVDFIPVVPMELDYVLVGDTGGTVYALPSHSGSGPVALAWQTSIGNGMVVAAPTVVNGIAFAAITGAENKLAALNARTGEKIWSKPLRASTHAQPQPYQQTILTVTADGYLSAYSTNNGDLAWELDVLHLTRGRLVKINGSLLIDDTLYLTTDYGLGAVNVAAQTVLWGTLNNLQFPYAPEIAEGIMYAGCMDNNLYAVDASNGNLIFTYPTGGVVHSQPQVTGGVVIFGSDDGKLYGLNGTTGDQLWQLDFSGPVRSFYLYANMLFVVDNSLNGHLYAYTLDIIDQQTWNWHLSWQYSISNGAQSDPLINGSIVYVTGSDSYVYAFNVLRGDAPLFAVSLEQVAFAGPALVNAPTGFDTSRRYDQVCWLGAHNAYANSADGWWYAQQSKNLINQLNDGVRMLMLDIWICNDQVVYAHEGCAVAWLLMPFSPFKLFSDSLREIRSWLDENPNEMVTLALEQRTGSRDMTQAAVTAAGIGPYIFDPVNDWNVQTQGWPSLAWMIASGKRLVVFSDWGKYVNYISGGDGFPYVWTYAVENDYGDDSMNGQFNARTGSQPIDKSRSPGIALFIQNYYRSSTFYLEPEYWMTDGYLTNDFNRIIGFVQGFQDIRQRLPNFLAVNFYELGLHGGPGKVVAEVNNRLSQATGNKTDKE